jgi:anti-anti-sigma factor
VSSSETPYRFETAEGYSVFSLQPELNDSQWADFEKVGNDVVGQLDSMDPPICLVDLSDLSYMGSAMVALIVRVWKAVNENGGRMVVVNKDTMVFEVLKLAGLHKVWTIVETRDEGVKQLGVKVRAVRAASSGEGGAPAGGGGMGLAALGLGAVVGAGAGLFLLLTPGIVSQKIALVIEFGFAALALVAGTVTAARDTGTRQKLGIAVVAASVVVVLAGILLSGDGADRQPRARASAPPSSSPPAQANSAPADKEEENGEED